MRERVPRAFFDPELVVAKVEVILGRLRIGGELRLLCIELLADVALVVARGRRRRDRDRARGRLHARWRRALGGEPGELGAALLLIELVAADGWRRVVQGA